MYLVRHGQSVGNALGHVTGAYGCPLTEQGRSSVLDLRRLCEAVQLEWTHYYASPMARAIETSRLLVPSARFEIVPALEETDAGICAEWTLSRFNAEYPEFFSDFRPERCYPKGESHHQLYARCTRWFERMVGRASDGDRILIVAHGGSINSILHYALEIPLSKFPWFNLLPASLSILRVEIMADSYHAQYALEQVNIFPSQGASLKLIGGKRGEN
ncbi:histidine phosphatase family protein [Candidatus Nitrospira bockiana]